MNNNNNENPFISNDIEKAHNEIDIETIVNEIDDVNTGIQSEDFVIPEVTSGENIELNDEQKKNLISFTTDSFTSRFEKIKKSPKFAKIATIAGAAALTLILIATNLASDENIGYTDRDNSRNALSGQDDEEYENIEENNDEVIDRLYAENEQKLNNPEIQSDRYSFDIQTYEDSGVIKKEIIGIYPTPLSDQQIQGLGDGTYKKVDIIIPNDINRINIMDREKNGNILGYNIIFSNNLESIEGLIVSQDTIIINDNCVKVSISAGSKNVILGKKVKECSLTGSFIGGATLDTTRCENFIQDYDKNSGDNQPDNSLLLSDAIFIMGSTLTRGTTPTGPINSSLGGGPLTIKVKTTNEAEVMARRAKPRLDEENREYYSEHGANLELSYNFYIKVNRDDVKIWSDYLLGDVNSGELNQLETLENSNVNNDTIEFEYGGQIITAEYDPVTQYYYAKDGNAYIKYEGFWVQIDFN